MLRKAIFLTISVCALVSQSAMAQTNLGFKGIGGNVGVVNAEDMDATFGLGLHLDHGTIVPNLALESRVDYWSKSEEVFGGEASVRDIAVGARCKYLFNVSNPVITPFAGAGLGLHFLKAEVSVLPPPGFPGEGMSVEDSETKLGLDLGGGMAAALSPRTSLLAELWYGIVSDVSQLSLRVGMTYHFGPSTMASKSGGVVVKPESKGKSKSKGNNANPAAPGQQRK
jgi:opacity protein-like surface antigen